MAMQNYAKFNSNVVSESMDRISPNSYGGGGYGYSLTHDIINLFQGVIQFLLFTLITILVIFALFSFLYILVSLFTKGGEKTMEEIKKAGYFIGKYTFKVYSGVFNFCKNILMYFWNRKILSIFIALVIFGISFTGDVINGNSRLLILTKINNGYVGVDLKNSKILEPGYHLYSPIKTSIFLSPTNDFAFEIAEVTANTSEELGVTLDYRVSYKIENSKRLAFYNKYGAKSIKLVSSDIVMPKLLEVIKGIIKSYGYKDISSKHSEIKNITLIEANKVLNETGIDLQDISIIDIRLPQSYLKSKEDLLKSENELKLAEARLEAQKKESEKNLLEANNKKAVKIIEAEAILEYNKIVKTESITDDMIELKKLENETLKLEKWDGKLPSTVGDNLDL